MHLERIRRLRELMVQQGLPAILITNETNRSYMTGFTGSAGYVILTEDRAILLTDFRYTHQASQQAASYQIVEHAQKHTDTIRDLLSKLKISRIGFEQQDVTYGAYLAYAAALSGIELIPADSLVETIRMVKDPAEIAVMKEAAQLADRTFSHVLNLLKPGIMERDVALEIEMFVRRHGAASTSFETIVASGERSALPHGKASDRVLQNNEFVKLDFGAYYKGYCSDLTRTIVLGAPSAKHKQIYDIVLEAQREALAGIRPGMTGKEADAIARKVIGRYGFGDNFGHGLGHGLGMQIHEAPRLSLSGEMILKPGMTVTVEPGIYLPGFGGVRIEDDVVITETGVEIITSSTKQLLTL